MMMEDQATMKARLEALPRTIGDANRRLLQVIEKLDVLEDFLLGSQPTDPVTKVEEETEVGVVDTCFRNLVKMSNSIEGCYIQLGSIIERLGIPEKPGGGTKAEKSY